MRKWAARTPGSNVDDSWYKAQDQFAKMISDFPPHMKLDLELKIKEMEAMPPAVIGAVRNEARYCMKPDSFGDDLEASKVDSFGNELADMLIALGYKEIVYRMDQDMVTIAYIKNEVPFRQEPILLDYGGAILPQSEGQVTNLLSKIGKPHDPDDIDPMGGNYVLKIAIRDANGANEDLHYMVVQLLAKYGIVNPNKGCYCPPAEGTVVYALKGFNEPFNEPPNDGCFPCPPAEDTVVYALKGSN